MLATGLLLLAATIAGITDVRSRKIYNWTTYPGILAALALNAWHWSPPEEPFVRDTLGCIGLEESLKGLALCGGLMLAGFVLFGIGGGDVKLLAMAGAILGMEPGLEVLLWTFVLGGILGAVILIWRVGAVRLLQRVCGWGWSIVRWSSMPEPTPEERRLFRSDLFLAPCVAVAVILVKSGWLLNM